MSTKQYKVILPKNKRPGIVSCGTLVPDKEYEVDAREAVRLVDGKGFEFVGKGADEKAARAEVAAQEKAEADAKAAAETKAKADAAKAVADKAAPAAQEG